MENSRGRGGSGSIVLLVGILAVPLLVAGCTAAANSDAGAGAADLVAGPDLMGVVMGDLAGADLANLPDMAGETPDLTMGGMLPAPTTWVFRNITYQAYQPGTMCNVLLGAYYLKSQSPQPNVSSLTIWTKSMPMMAGTYDCKFPMSGLAADLLPTEAFIDFSGAGGTWYCSGGKVMASIVGGKVSYTFVDVPVKFSNMTFPMSGNVLCQ